MPFRKGSHLLPGWVARTHLTVTRLECLNGQVGALHGLFRLMRSTDPSTKSIVGRAVCNLLSFEDSRAVTVGEGGMEVGGFEYLNV